MSHSVPTILDHEARIAQLESNMKELAELQLRSAKAGLMKAIGVKMLADRVNALENKLDGNAPNKKRKIFKDNSDSDEECDECGMCHTLNANNLHVRIPASSVKSNTQQDKDFKEELQRVAGISSIVDAVDKAVKDFNAANPTKKVKLEAIRIEGDLKNAAQPLPESP